MHLQILLQSINEPPLRSTAPKNLWSSGDITYIISISYTVNFKFCGTLYPRICRLPLISETPFSLSFHLFLTSHCIQNDSMAMVIKPASRIKTEMKFSQNNEGKLFTVS